MADFDIFTRNYVFDSGVIASTPGTSETGNTPDKAIDRSKVTFWETTDATPDLDIDLNIVQDIDSVWFHAENVTTYEIYHSDNGTDYTIVGTAQTSIGDYDYFLEFTPATKRYWRIRVTAETVPGNNTKIYAVVLAKHKLGLSYDEIFARVRENIVDVDGGSQKTATGRTITWSGMSGIDSIKEELELEFSFIDKSIRDSLLTIWKGPPVRQPCVMFPFKTLYPDRIWEVAWQENNFPLTNTGLFGSDVYSGIIPVVEI